LWGARIFTPHRKWELKKGTGREKGRIYLGGTDLELLDRFKCL